ncbi:MAG: galactokinase family protein [Candidatus Latescibacterota bacterium]|nr:galactokinase family protein [Candidatus Latescibacterota bacterium]
MTSLARWQDVDVVARALRAGGLDDEVTAKAQRFASAARRLAEHLSDDTPAQAWFVPGRIEVLGKHTDYCGGHSLTAAVARGFCVVASARDDTALNLYALDEDDEVSATLDPELQPSPGAWSNYPLTVARRLARNFPNCCRGADLAFSSDLPAAAGMSSSSALIVATYLVMASINDLEASSLFRDNIRTDFERADYLGTVENGQTFRDLEGDRGVGTFGGSEDHTAILCSQANALAEYTYCPTRFRRHVELPAEWLFVIGVSGVVAEKTGQAQMLYNRASQLVQAIVDCWRAAGGSETYLAHILQSEERYRALQQAIDTPPSPVFPTNSLHQRLEHYRREMTVLSAATDALESSAFDEFAVFVAHSQQLSEELLNNQVEETVVLCRLAVEAGALTASAFGAGFGGSVWALVRRSQMPIVVEAWATAYRRAFPCRAEASQFFTTPAGPPAFALSM